jgi:hypothetical protein
MRAIGGVARVRPLELSDLISRFYQILLVSCISAETVRLGRCCHRGLRRALLARDMICRIAMVR